MKYNDKVSIFNYLESFISFRLFNQNTNKKTNQNKLYWLLICASAPLLFGSPSVASVTVIQQIAQASPTFGFNRPSLKAGSQGEVVIELQAALKLLGFYNGAVDGKYGDTTVAAVSSFKESAGLAADGVVDTATWQKLFPGQGNISTTTASSLPAPTTNTTSVTSTTSITSNRFPIPRQNTQNSGNLPRPIVVSNSELRNSLPKPNNPINTGNAQQLETVRATSITRTSTTTNPQQPKPRLPKGEATRSQSSLAQNRGSTSTNIRTSTTSRSGRSNSSTSTSTRTGRGTATSTTIRSPRVSQAQQKPGIQYSVAGFPILRLGMRGDEVYELQRRLQRFGYLKNDPDGDFGAATETAVKALQQRFGIEPDGVAGGETWEVLTRRRKNQS
ncbi:peptidoglycan-binding domain-containing protein [Brunnivagina elsteri]|uniref:Peptidoglycan-binding protein n=1 Tax=Brunnivagina elsteri CCALA 953 TaxID=987040 RepID=A0A2A2TN22_9CYAN|nr:peptidoglycan-binding protein [Calothrix elsteri]PAX59936.1 peptidoglycan-binding protein [Calothrix elsteri CCALA 953]